MASSEFKRLDRAEGPVRRADVAKDSPLTEVKREFTQPAAPEAASTTWLPKPAPAAPPKGSAVAFEPAKPPRAPVQIQAGNALELRDRLKAAFDRHGDDQITEVDFKQRGRRLPGAAIIQGPDGERFTLSGVEQINQVASSAAKKVREGRGADWFRVPELLQPRTAAMAEEISHNWPLLVRRFDSVSALLPAFANSHVASPDGAWRIYVPEGDVAALERLRAEAATHNEKAAGNGGLRVEVRPFPAKPDAATWQGMNDLPGMAYLPRPAPAPGGMFHEMYGWDSAFMALGILDGDRPDRVDLARDVLENYVYEIDHYGKIPNSNASHLMSRSQPPLMPRLALALDDARPDPALLRRAAEAGLKELAGVWKSERRATPSGLSRYSDDHDGKLIEIPAGRYEYFPDDPEFLRHQRAIRESGHDDTHQFGQAAHHYEPVELNSLLYRYERELAEIWRRVEGPASVHATALEADAAERLKPMQAHFWSEKLGMFVDYDFHKGAQSTYLSDATFFPLADGWATPEQARRVAENAGRFLEKGGLAATARASRKAAGGESLQWDHPFGWGPLQEVAVEGLRRYGYQDLANEIAYRWLYMVLDVAGRHNGLVKEKYDVVKASPDVTVEYGNQGNGRGGLTQEEPGPIGFGWTNSTFTRLLRGLPPELREKLDAGAAPDVLFPRRPTPR